MRLLPLIAAALCLPLGVARAETLTIGISQYPDHLHPIIESMAVRSYVLGFMRRGMLAFDADWRLTCLSCTEVPSRANGRLTEMDGATQARFTLKDGLYWADGTEVTPGDFILGRDVARLPEMGAPSHDFMANRILEIRQEGEKDLIVRFDRPLCDLAELTQWQPLPSSREYGALTKFDGDYRKDSFYIADPTMDALWNGPYRLAAQEPGQYLRLAPNEHWQGPRPQFDEIILKVLSDTSALAANLLSGDIDMIAGEAGLPLDQAIALEPRLAPNWRMVTRGGLAWEHIDLRLDHPALSDATVRRALLLGLDRPAIIQGLFGGRYELSDSIINPAMAGITLPAFASDPDEASRLLDEAGWTGAPIRMKDGQKLRLTIATTAGNRARELVEQVLQQQWAAIGVELVVANVETRQLVSELTQHRAFEAMTYYGWSLAPHEVPRTILHSSQVPTAENGWTGQNYPGLADPATDNALDILAGACDATARAAAWQDLANAYAQSLPALPLWFRADAWILPAGLDGLRPTGHNGPTSLGVENWRMTAP